MKSRAKTLIVISLLTGYAVAQFAAAGSSRAVSTPAPAAQDFPTPPTSITNALATVPPDAKGIPTQGNMNLYSWLAFVALNWPANSKTCGPDLTTTILSGKGPTVWETYPTDADIFVAPPATPDPWCAQSSSQRQARLAQLPPRTRAAAQRLNVSKFLFRLTKVSANLNQKFPGIEQAIGGPLTDQAGRFVRYEVRANQDEYNFVTQNTLWSKAGQGQYTSTIAFPVGPSNYGPTGAIEIKAAWKVLTPRESASGRFYTTWAVVYNDDAGHASPGTNPVQLGLVGFHIIHKTRSQPNWIWSTFEQVDNLTAPPGSPFGAKASFFNPGCPPATCPPDAQTAPSPYTELDQHGKPLNKPVQVVRLNPVGDPNVDQLNAAFRKLLAGSVWANYKLVSTQWVGEDGTLPKPPFLANMTLETFIQAPRPPSDGPIPFPSPGYNPFAIGVASSSCLKCHSVATTAGSSKKADFSFLLGEAQ